MKKILNAARTLPKFLRHKASVAIHGMTRHVHGACARAVRPFLKRSACCVIAQNRGDGFVDTALKILMAVVIGALILAGLYTLFGDQILPTLTRRITELFNYAG